MGELVHTHALMSHSVCTQRTMMERARGYGHTSNRLHIVCGWREVNNAVCFYHGYSILHNGSSTHVRVSTYE